MIEQRTDEWLMQRRGKFTASEIHRLMGIKGLGKTGETYVWEKVAEELGATMPPVTTYAMQRGMDMEPVAKVYYSKAFNSSISPAEFIAAPWCDEAGASPDGIVTDWENTEVQKLIEIKCPMNPTHHLIYFTIKSVADFKREKPEYYWQVQLQMAVTGINQCDFVSFYPEIDEDFRMVALTVDADPGDIGLMKLRIAEAVTMKHEILKTIGYTKTELEKSYPTLF